MFDWNIKTKFKRWLLLIGSLIGAGLIFYLLKFILNKKKKSNPIREAYQKILKDLSSQGLEVPLTEGPKTIFRRARDKWPHAARDLQQLHWTIEKLRYADAQPFPPEQTEKIWAKKIILDWQRIRAQI